MEVDGDFLGFAKQAWGKLGSECLVKRPLQIRQRLDGKLVVEIETEGIGAGHRGEISTDRLKGLSAGGDAQQHVVEVLTVTFVASGFEGQVPLEYGSCLMQGLLIGQRWYIGHRGLVLLWIVCWRKQSTTAGRALCFFHCTTAASSQIRIY